MIYTVEEKAVATLQELRSPASVVVLHHLPAEWRQVLGVLLLDAAESEPVINATLIIEVAPLRVHLQPQRLLREFRALKHIAELRGASRPPRLILLLQLRGSEVALLEMELQVVLGVELLLADLALEGSAVLRLVREVLQLVLDGTEVAEQALVGARQHGDPVLREDGFDFRLDSV